MTVNSSIAYHNSALYVDGVPVTSIIETTGTPTYIYSAKRIIANIQRIVEAFRVLDTHIHYSAKANANLSLLRLILAQGVGIDAVSGGEIFRALEAGAQPRDIVYAGVGKSVEEIRFALENGIGWFNVENVKELDHIQAIAVNLGVTNVQIALRLNPDITANTHPYIATGHGGAKFGLTRDSVQMLLQRQSDYPNLLFRGIHVHIGSQLGDTKETVEAVDAALNIAQAHPTIDTINIGGGLPVAYSKSDELPAVSNFADAVASRLKDYHVLLEPGRSIIADAGILVGKVLYTKQQAGQHILISDTSMTELIRPALYQAHHDIVPVEEQPATELTQVVGPVCETSDVLGQDRLLPFLAPDALIAILTAGAYGSVMSSNYNARPRPTEVLVNPDGVSWQVIRKRETWQDLIASEQF